MFTLLLVLLTASITFLITDYRRHLEIVSLKAFLKAKYDNEIEIAYHFGLKEGARIQRQVPYEQTPMHTNN